MEYLKGYKVFRSDPDWTRKVLVGAALFMSTMIIPMIGQVVLVGWQALIMRRAVKGQDEPLPRLDFDFDYLGKLLGIGFKGFIVRFLWSMPAMMLGFGVFFCLYFGAIAVGVTAAESGGDGAIGLALLCCIGVAVLVWIPFVVVLTIPANVAAMRAELTDDLNQGLRFKEVLDFTRVMFKPLFVGSLALWVVGMGLAIAGLLLCYVGIFPVVVLGTIAHAHLMAQIYRRWVEQGGEQLEIAALEVPAPGGGAGGGALPPQGAPGPQGTPPPPPSEPSQGGWTPPPGG